MLSRVVVLFFVFAVIPASSALAADSPTGGLILHSWQMQDGRVSQEVWCDQSDWHARTLNYDAGGSIEGQTVVSVKGRTVRTDSLAYPDKTWTTFTAVLPPGGSDMGITDSQYFPATIRRYVKQRWIGAVGPRQKVDGYETIHLQGQVGSELLEYWVRPGSYLIVQARQTPVANGGPVGAGSTVEFSWLPATAANLAKTRLSVPPGFTHHQGTVIG